MANIILNQQAEAELKKLGFHNKRMPNSTMTELDRIKADEELVAQINEFRGKGKSFLEIPNKGSGAYYSPKKGNIYFEPNSQYITARILAHEVGHALGKNQAKSVDYYLTAKSYAQARGYGEAEAIYNEARMVAYEERRNGRAYSTHISGGLYSQVKGKSYEQVKDLLARENMYGMYPSTNGSVRLSYYENDILFFMHRRTAFEKDFAEAGLRKSDMVGFVKHMANYDTFGDSRGNSVNANGAVDRQSLLHGKPTTRLNGGASMYGDAGNDVMTGTKSHDRMLGGSGDDKLEGGDGNDLLAGNEGKDGLYGGRGYDTYRADRYDIIRDEDGKGEVFLDGRRLHGGVRDLSEHDRTIFRDGNTGYDWNKKTGTLDVNGLKIENFKNGDLGIRLEEPKKNMSGSGVSIMEMYQKTRENIDRDWNKMSQNRWDFEMERMAVSEGNLSRIEDLPLPAQKLFHSIKERLGEYHEKHGLPTKNEEAMNNAAMSLAALGYSKTMGKGNAELLFNIKDGHYLIGELTPILIKATMDVNSAGSTSIEESIKNIRQTEQKFEYEVLQRQLDQSQFYGMSR